MANENTRVRRRERKNITSGVAHVNSTFNNTLITITDAQGNAISWSSAGSMASKAHANRPLMRHKLLPKMPVAKRWNMASRRLK